MNSSKYVIEAANLHKEYKMGEISVHALKGVNFKVKHGVFLSIMGPSGSGKSTLMNLIGCLDTPSGGVISINGSLTSKMKERELAVLRNQSIGFVFQQFNLLSGLTVLENVMTPLLYAGVSVKERRYRAEKVLDEVGLSDRMGHRPPELSGGQKQRVAVARAMVTRPAIILADEPTGALDEATGQQILKLFRDIHQEGTTVIIVTHDPEIGASADESIQMRDGRIV